MNVFKMDSGGRGGAPLIGFCPTAITRFLMDFVLCDGGKLKWPRQGIRVEAF